MNSYEVSKEVCSDDFFLEKILVTIGIRANLVSYYRYGYANKSCRYHAGEGYIGDGFAGYYAAVKHFKLQKAIGVGAVIARFILSWNQPMTAAFKIHTKRALKVVSVRDLRRVMEIMRKTPQEERYFFEENAIAIASEIAWEYHRWLTR